MLRSEYSYKVMHDHRKLQAVGFCFQCTYTLSFSVHFVHFSSRKNAVVLCHTYWLHHCKFTWARTEWNYQDGEFIRQIGTENLRPLRKVAAKFSVSPWGSLKGTRRWPLLVTLTYLSVLLVSPRLHAVTFTSHLEKTEQEVSAQNKVTLFPTTDTLSTTDMTFFLQISPIHPEWKQMTVILPIFSTPALPVSIAQC